MTLTTTVDVNIAAALTSALDLVTASAPLSLSNRITIPTGTASGQADVCWSDTRTVTASGTDALDLAGSGRIDTGSLQVALETAYQMAETHS